MYVQEYLRWSFSRPFFFVFFLLLFLERMRPALVHSSTILPKIKCNRVFPFPPLHLALLWLVPFHSFLYLQFYSTRSERKKERKKERKRERENTWCLLVTVLPYLTLPYLLYLVYCIVLYFIVFEVFSLAGLVWSGCLLACLLAGKNRTQD